MGEEFKETMIRLYGSIEPKEIQEDPQIESDYANNKISFIERQIMYNQQNYLAFNDMMFVPHEIYYDSNTAPNFSTVNAEFLLLALYKVHKEHPEMRLDDKFSSALPFTTIDSYNSLKYCYYIVKYQMEGIATFNTDITEILIKNKERLQRERFFNILLNQDRPEYLGYENRAIGAFEEYNELFKSQLGIDIFEGNEMYENLISSRRR